MDLGNLSWMCRLQIPSLDPRIPLQTLSIDKVKESGRAAKKSYNKKVASYGAIATRNSLEFLPIIIETTGRIEDHAKAYVESIAEEASVSKKIKKSILYKYMMNRISCTFQRNLANSIICRANTINGHGSHSSERAYTVSYGFVRDHENVFAGDGWRI